MLSVSLAPELYCCKNIDREHATWEGQRWRPDQHFQGVPINFGLSVLVCIDTGTTGLLNDGLLVFRIKHATPRPCPWLDCELRFWRFLRIASWTLQCNFRCVLRVYTNSGLVCTSICTALLRIERRKNLRSAACSFLKMIVLRTY